MRRNKTADMNAKGKRILSYLAYKDTRSNTPRRPISVILPSKQNIKP